MSHPVPPPEVASKIKLVDEMIRDGLSLSKACKTAKLSKKTYYRYRGKAGSQETSSPEGTVSQSVSRPDKSAEAGGSSPQVRKPSEGEKGTSSQPSSDELKDVERKIQRMKSEADEVDKRLRAYGLIGAEPDSELLKKWRALKAEISSQEQALNIIRREMGLSAPVGAQAPPASPEEEEGGKEAKPEPEPADAITALSQDVERLEERKKRLRDTLQKMGFKVEDIYVTREEHERAVEEARKAGAEEALDDKRIGAVERIINNAVTQIVQMFQPAVQRWMELQMVSAPSRGQSSSQES